MLQFLTTSESWRLRVHLQVLVFNCGFVFKGTCDASPLFWGLHTVALQVSVDEKL